MKIKTSELTGPALDWAVAKCEGVDSEAARLFHDEGYYNYSTDWAQGGPIIEREEIELTFDRTGEDTLWRAEMFDLKGVSVAHEYGPTPLIAAMRCYVAYKLGDEVEIPEELTMLEGVSE